MPYFQKPNPTECLEEQSLSCQAASIGNGWVGGAGDGKEKRQKISRRSKNIVFFTFHKHVATCGPRKKTNRRCGAPAELSEVRK